MSEAVPSILQARNRAWNYWGTDGIYAMIQGVALLLSGLGFLWDHHNKRSILPGVLIWLSVVIMLDQAFFRKIVGWLKSRITYPRTGYTKPPVLRTPHPSAALLSPADREQLRKQRWFWLALAGWLATAAAIVGYAITTGHRWVIFPGSASLVLLVWYRMHRKFGEAGKLVCFLFSPILLAEALLTFLPTDWMTSLSIMIIALAISIILIGATTLSRYLKEHPAPQA